MSEAPFAIAQDCPAKPVYNLKELEGGMGTVTSHEVRGKRAGCIPARLQRCFTC